MRWGTAIGLFASGAMFAVGLMLMVLPMLVQERIVAQQPEPGFTYVDGVIEGARQATAKGCSIEQMFGKR